MLKTKVIQTRLFSNSKFLAITLFGLVFTADKKRIDKRLLNHELIHCHQQLEWLYIPFFILYLGEWGWQILLQIFDPKRKVDFLEAYYRISFEREAYRHDSDLDYLRHRPLFANYRNK